MPFFASIILSASLASLAAAIAPEGKSRRFVLFGISLFLVLSLLREVRGALDGTLLPDLSFSVTDPTKSGTSAASPVFSAGERALAELLSDEFGLADCEVAFSGDGSVPEKIAVTLPKSSAVLVPLIRARVEGMIEGPVTVEVGYDRT